MKLGSLCVVASVLVCCVLSWLATAAFSLPPGRAYEMVSPIYKGGFGVLFVEGVSPDGENVAFYSPGAFAGAPASLTNIDYLAHRETTGWSTLSEMTPALLAPDLEDRDISPTLGTIMNLGKAGANKEGAAQEGTEERFLLHQTNLPNTAANWELAGFGLRTLLEKSITLTYQGASSDFCHLLFRSGGGQAKDEHVEALLPEAIDTVGPVYELDRGCDDTPPTIRLVAVNAAGQSISPSCQVDAGIDDYHTASPSAYNALASGGNEVFFTTCVDNLVTDHQLFVRLGGTTTLEISKPISETETCVQTPTCKKASTRPSANFAGASEDGSMVFFTTTAPLAGEDVDAGNDLYMARIGCPEGATECETGEKVVTSLVQLSHAGEAAEVQGVARVAPDGSHVYFVARGVLSGDNSEGVAPVRGADNLYVYDSRSGDRVFIGVLCSGHDLSGLAEDLHCPSTNGIDTSLWTSGGEVQTGGKGGRFLVFATYSALTSDDTDAAKDVYRYDSETGILTRVSIGEGGYDANGNDSSFDATIAAGHRGRTVRFQSELNNRAITEDGTQIVFTTAGPLSAGDVNHLTNVYIWTEGGSGGEGEVSLVSSGSAVEPDSEPVISLSGKDIIFRTDQGLVRQDTDGAPDVYDARVGGGFPESPAPREECSADACQGPLTNPAPLLVPASSLQTAGENFAAKTMVSKTKKKTKIRTKRKPAKKKKRRALHLNHVGKRSVTRRGER